MLTQVSNFLDDSTGMEKTLRLAQGLCTSLAGLAATAEATTQYSKAKSQINLGRRYLRLHKWHPCFRSAYHHFNRSELGALEKLLEVAKWSFLGLYFLLEMPTLTNAMRITNYDWGDQLQHEALKCWFYGISWSLVLGVYQYAMLYFADTSTSTQKAVTSQKMAKGEKGEKEPSTTTPKEDLAKKAEWNAARAKIHTQLAIDALDIFLPGSAVGWLNVDPVMVGACQALSSVLAIKGVWDKVQQSG